MMRSVRNLQRCLLTHPHSLAALRRFPLEGAGFAGERRGRRGGGGAGLQLRRLQGEGGQQPRRRGGTQALVVVIVVVIGLCEEEAEEVKSMSQPLVMSQRAGAGTRGQSCQVTSRLCSRRRSPGSPIRDGEDGDGFSWQGDSDGDSSEGSSGPGDGSLWEPLLHRCTGAGARWPSGMSKIW